MRVDQHLPRQLVVTGTDTGVGKTVVAAMLAAGLKASYWKPIQSGLVEGSDTATVRSLSGLPEAALLPEAYRLQAPLSPHAAAALEGVAIDPARLSLPRVEGRLLIEGVGGLMVPINDQTLFIDLIRQWRLPVLLVARSRLGTINHTLLSLYALRAYGIEVVGVVMNGPSDPVSRQAIECYGQVRVLGEVPDIGELNALAIRRTYEQSFGGEGFGGGAAG